MKTKLLIPILLFSSFAYSQDVKLKGFGSTGIAIYDQNIFNGTNQETYYRGKLQLDMEITDKIESQLDFRGDSRNNSVTLREFSAKFSYFPSIRFKVGNIKKPFGYEYSINIENNKFVNRSFNFDNISDIGFTRRSFSLMVYRKFKEDRNKTPVSYFVSLFKNNSRETGLSTRFSYHNYDITYSLSYQFFNKGGNESIDVHGIGGDIVYEKKKITLAFEAAYVKDFQEGIIRRLQSLDENVYSVSTLVMGSYKFDSGYDVIKDIEPVLGAGFFAPDSKDFEANNIQVIAGANLYFHKRVRVRINADLRMTKNKFSDEYSTETSNFIAELQVSF